METVTPIASSFRDPNGFVFKYNGVFYRAVNIRYEASYNHLMRSGLYDELVQQKLLIPHGEVNLPIKAEPGIYKTLLPDQISFISYPYEWCFEQWKEVIYCFLEINRISLKYGMIMQDATPFNFTFLHGRPVFFDTISFVFYHQGEPWIAYRQFCQSMLGPFALIKYNGSNWVKQFSSFINGLELSYISKELPWRTYLNPVLLLHIHFHARFEGNESGGRRDEPPKGFNTNKLLALMQMIRRTLDRWKSPESNKIKWLNYYRHQIISNQYLISKDQIIQNWLAVLRVGKLTDLGANNGRYTMMAAGYASEVIAVEEDPDCVNDLHKQVMRSAKENISVIQADLMQPSPGIGWNNNEREQLLKRLEADTVLALALIHHLCIVNNISLDLFAAFISSVTKKHAIVEFIPKSDPMVEKMLFSREDIFEYYTENNFVSCFEKYFTIEQKQQPGPTDRILYLWAKK
jgi:hypothetical protein